MVDAPVARMVGAAPNEPQIFVGSAVACRSHRDCDRCSDAIIPRGLFCRRQNRQCGNDKKLVEGVTAAGTQPLSTGTEVYSNELVRTRSESKAELLFLDNTNLSVGPVSTIRLDKFVYDPNGSKGNGVLRAGVGSFRFITGLQDKKSYTIQTA